jgi:hypothetical protein
MSWALLANRRSCFAGDELALAFSASAYTRQDRYIQGLLDGKKFPLTTYTLDRPSQEAALARLFEQAVSPEDPLLAA